MKCLRTILDFCRFYNITDINSRIWSENEFIANRSPEFTVI